MEHDAHPNAPGADARHPANAMTNSVMTDHGITDNSITDTAVQAVLQNPRFIQLVHKKRALSWSLSALMLIIYIGFILLVAYAPDFLHRSFSGVITWGIPLGIGVIVAAIVLSAIYSAIANGEYERLTQQVVEDIQRAQHPSNTPTGSRVSAPAQGGR